MSDYVYPVNIGNPNEITMNDFAQEILRLTGSNQKIINLPLPTDDPKQRRPDITKAQELLGWKPKVDRAEGLKITYEYFSNFTNEQLNSQKEFKVFY